MDVSIIILNYKTCNLLKNCLNSIIQTQNNVNYEIIIIDNNSNDGTEQMLNEHFPDIHAIFLPKNIGHAGGNNVGIRKAQGKYILLLNTDIVFLKNHVLDEITEFLNNHPEVAVMAPKLISPDGTAQNNCRKFPTILQPLYSRTFLGHTAKGKKFMDQFLLNNVDKTQTRTVDWVQSSCMAIRNEALKRVGLMDELFFIYFSDVDWCKRFWLEGYKIYYHPQISVIHYFHRESADIIGIKALLSPITRLHIKDWLKFIAKYNLPFTTFKNFTSKYNYDN